jgi:very-short-patch-repair endonuclease
MRGPDRHHLPRARELRRSSTLAEARLWEQLRAKRLGGVKFVRQHPIGPYFADFACRSRMIVIEVDGATHGTDAERAHDRKRTAFLQQLGYRVLRFGNDEVLNGMDGVLSLVSGALSEAPSPPCPVPGPP